MDEILSWCSSSDILRLVFSLSASLVSLSFLLVSNAISPPILRLSTFQCWLWHADRIDGWTSRLLRISREFPARRRAWNLQKYMPEDGTFRLICLAPLRNRNCRAARRTYTNVCHQSDIELPTWLSWKLASFFIDRINEWKRQELFENRDNNLSDFRGAFIPKQLLRYCLSVSLNVGWAAVVRGVRYRAAKLLELP